MTRLDIIASYRNKLRAIREKELWEFRRQNHAIRNALNAFNWIEDLITGGANDDHAQRDLPERTGT